MKGEQKLLKGVAVWREVSALCLILYQHFQLFSSMAILFNTDSAEFVTYIFIFLMGKIQVMRKLRL